MQSFQNSFRSIQEIPLPYRNVFREYPCFNIVQSEVLDEAIKTDKSLVISAPTGSGKTAIFEMAIIRHLILSEESLNVANNKIVYISPIKALCKERLLDWHEKFADFNIRSISITSDTDDVDVRNMEQYNLIITTPEKWDIISKRWRENCNLIGSISLFLIDEVHLLNVDSRGPALEVIVSRMKTAMASLVLNQEKLKIRFVALSATIPNIEDIAEWIGPPETTKYFQFSEDVRPVKLNKIVMGYYFNPQHQSIFRFDMSLNYKLPGLISKYSNGKPTLIFCNTRKSVEMTANHLISNLQIRLTQQQKDTLTAISAQLNDVKLKQCIVHGIAFHHAGLMHDNRYTIEDSFRKGSLSVLVTTSTLAMGVNLPAHLVIVKSTKCYTDGGYKDCDEVSLFQMIGRAGRSQFDSSATALILTSMQDKEKYEQMLGCTQTIESNLHKHLTEHLNAEVALRTITDLDVAMRWLSSTFLYVRARKSPEKYKLPAGLGKEKIDKKLLEMCQIELNKLVGTGMMKMNEAIEVAPTVVGQIMAKYYVAFDTMKLFTQIAGSEILIQILAIISKCKEFSDIYLRNNDKKCLNTLNKNNHKESNRFPLAGKIKTVDMKVNCIIQAILGNLDIHDQSIICDSFKIMRNCERLANCLIEYLETRDKCYSALLNTIILAKCFRVKLWENSPYISKQLTGVGQVMSTLLMKAGKTSFKEIAAANPRNIETIVGRKAPFGNTIVEEASHLPQYTMALEKQENAAKLLITFLNPRELEEKPTLSLDSSMILLVGDSDNNILLYEKYSHSYLMDNPEVRRSISTENRKLDFIKANLISENWVGIDCSCCLDICGNTGNVPVANVNQRQRCKQTFMDIYLQHVKKTYKKKNENKTNTNSNSAKKKDNLNKPTPNNKTLEKNTSKQHVDDQDFETPMDLLKKNHQENINKFLDELEKEKTATEEEENDYCDANFSKFEKIYDKRLKETKTTVSKDKENKRRDDSKCNENKESIDDENEQLLQSMGKNNNSSKNIEDKEETLENINGHTNKIPNDIIEKMREKYKSTRKESKSHSSACASQNEEISKKTMDNPDSTVEHNMFQRGYYFAPRPKRPREDERHASAFAEVFPQKSITWRSPLVHSPAEKFSPLRFNFVNNTSESIDIPLGAEDTTTSISSPNLSPYETSEKPSCSKSLKKKPKYQFPLSDRDYAASEVNNESVSKKLDELDAICDLEEFGFVIRKKESAKNRSASSKPRVAVGKYYSELLSNSQNKSQQNEPKSNLPKNAISTQSSEKKSAENKQQQQSQELFMQNDNVSSECVAKIYHDTKSFTQPAPVEYHQYNHDFPRRNHVDHTHTCDALNASFVEPSHYNFSELTQRRYVNPYLDGHRSNSYFGHHQPTRSRYSHMCCSRNPTRYPNAADPYHNPYLETIPEAAPCWDFAANRCLPPRAYYNIPEDHCPRPIDHHQPLRFMENRDMNRCSTSYFENVQSPVNNRSVLNFEKENLPPFYAEAPNSQTPRLNLREMYAATPKRHLVHAAPAFQSQVHPSTSDQKRMLNFHSFEERLNNSIIPRSLSSYASEDPRLHQRGNEKRDYVMNSFMFANNQNRTQ